MNLEFVITKFFQFLMLCFYVFVISVYAALVVLIPLAILFGIVNTLDHGLGFNGIFATLVGFGVVAWLVNRIRRIPGLTVTLLDTGWNLVKMAAESFKHFDDLAAANRPLSTPKTQTAARS